MATFRIKADATFEANDIDHAMELLALHFEKMSEDFYSDLLNSGEIHVKRIQEEDHE